MKRILVTRPEPGASRTARRLAELGFDPVVMPLTETRSIALTEEPDTSAFDAVAVTSGAALRHAPAALLRGLSGLPLFAVGARTAEAARQAGFEKVESAGGDAAALAARLADALPAGSCIAYVCGRVRTGMLSERLRAAGHAVTPIETYDTLPLEWPVHMVAAVLDGRPVDGVLIYSANAAVLMSRLMARPANAPLLHRTRLLCISERAARALPTQGRVEVAAAPDETALLALLGPAG